MRQHKTSRHCEEERRGNLPLFFATLNSLQRVAVTAVLCALALSHSAQATDWPQYRYNGARTSYTPETLPQALTLDWVRHARHQPHRAWNGRLLAPSRMQFDWCYTPVIADGMLFYGSSADHQVHALDATTGQEKWHIFTDAPVRLAPAVWQGHILAVSDDGHLYCLKAATGDLLWKLRARPKDELMIGNSRLVSRWAARGGPAIRDGTVYFAAGPWPVEGVYVYAVDIASGKVLWCNDASGAHDIEHPHMGSYAHGGAVSQGYLAVSRDRVYVSTGRSTPAVYDRQTGRLQHFHLSRYGGKTPWGVGGGDTVVTDEVYFNGGYVFDAPTGLRYTALGQDNRWIPYTLGGHKYHGQFLNGPGRDVALTPAGPLFYIDQQLHGGTLVHKTFEAKHEAQVLKYAQQLTHVSQLEGKSDKYHVERIDRAPTVKSDWTADLGVPATTMIVAGRVVYVGTQDQVIGLDTASKKVIWSGKMTGTVRALAAANGRLYAATDTGALYCFAEKGQGNIIRPRKRQSPYAQEGPVARRAQQILQKTGTQRGYCLDMDCIDGELAYHLASQSDLYVIAFTSDKEKRDEARHKLDVTGLYGTRAVVLDSVLTHALPPYLANLIVSQGISIDPPPVETYLSPYRGTLCLERQGTLQCMTRPPLPGAGTWTHSLGDSGNSLCSDDQRVTGPLGLLWYEDEDLLTIDRHGKNPAPLVAQGVMVRVGFDTVKGIDAYNGTPLWQYTIPGLLRDYSGGTGVGAVAMGSMCCIEGKVVYVRYKDTCYALDLLTGQQRITYTAPLPAPGKPGNWAYLAADQGILFGSLANESHIVRGQHGDGGERVQTPMDRHFTESTAIFALDTETGEQLWTYTAEKSIRNNSIAVGNGRAFFIDREPAKIDNLLKSFVSLARRRGEDLPEHAPGSLICTTARTGQQLWRDDQAFGTTLALSKAHDLLLMSYNKVGRALPSDAESTRTRCYRAATGNQLWDVERMGARPILNDRIIYSFPKAYDLFTGKPCALTEKGTDPVDSIQGKGIGCGTPIGSSNMLFVRSGAIGYYDIDNNSGWMETYGGIRSGCWLNAIPAGGIVLVPDDTRACRCSFPNQASVALYPRGTRPPMLRPVTGQRNWEYTQRLSPFEIDFTNTLRIEILPPDDRAYELRYTLDGSVPTKESLLYTAPLQIDSTSTINAGAFLNGKRQSLRLGVHCAKVNVLESGKNNKRSKRRRTED